SASRETTPFSTDEPSTSRCSIATPASSRGTSSLTSPDCLAGARQRKNRVGGRRVAHEPADIGVGIAPRVQRICPPEALRLLIANQPLHGALDDRIVARHSRFEQHQRDKTGGVTVARRKIRAKMRGARLFRQRGQAPSSIPSLIAQKIVHQCPPRRRIDQL